MTTRPYELLARFGENGLVAGVSVRTLTVVNGREVESDPFPIDAGDPAFAAFANQFAASVVAERDALLAQVKQLAGDLSTAQSAATVGAAAIAESEQLRAQVATLTARVDSLVAQLPFDPRKILVEAFLERLSKAELLWFFSDDDAGVVQIAAQFKQWSANAWPIALDSEQFIGAMQYLQSVGKLTAERVALLSVDASRAESFEG